MPSDAELIARICEHDADAFETLSTRYRESIYRHLLAILRESSATEDIVQEVFLRVWLHAEQWRGQGNVKAWLFRIATNLALNHLRTLRRHQQQPLELPDDPPDENDESSVPSWMADHSFPGPDILLEEYERRQTFQRLVEELPAEKRVVFRLVYENEMATRQVARALGIPEGTVKSRLHYATRRLARAWRYLQQEWEERR